MEMFLPITLFAEVYSINKSLFNWLTFVLFYAAKQHAGSLVFLMAYKWSVNLMDGKLGNPQW